LRQLNRVFLVGARAAGTYDRYSSCRSASTCPSPASSLRQPDGRRGRGGRRRTDGLLVKAALAPSSARGHLPALTRRFVAGGADFLVNVTNDAWAAIPPRPASTSPRRPSAGSRWCVPPVPASAPSSTPTVASAGRVRCSRWHVDGIARPRVTFYTRFGDLRMGVRGAGRRRCSSGVARRVAGPSPQAVAIERAAQASRAQSTVRAKPARSRRASQPSARADGVGSATQTLVSRPRSAIVPNRRPGEAEGRARPRPLPPACRPLPTLPDRAWGHPAGRASDLARVVTNAVAGRGGG
jgi:hypothetical protein